MSDLTVLQVIEVEIDHPDRGIRRGDRIYALSDGRLIHRRAFTAEEREVIEGKAAGALIPIGHLSEEAAELVRINLLMDEADAQYEREKLAGN